MSHIFSSKFTTSESSYAANFAPLIIIFIPLASGTLSSSSLNIHCMGKFRYFMYNRVFYVYFSIVTLKVHLLFLWPSSTPFMSKGIASSGVDSYGQLMKINSASESMYLFMSHALAVRSTLGKFQVTHFTWSIYC